MIGFLWRGVQRALVFAAIKQAERWSARFDREAQKPRELQDELLRRIIHTHRDTQFGKDHLFAAIRGLADLRRHLPIRGYDAIEPYMAQVRRGQFGALLNTRTVHMFAMTSGTTATRKTIPVTPQYLADYRRGTAIWGLKIFGTYRQMIMRPILQLTSDWQETRTEAGIPCGAVSGLTSEMQKRVVRWLYCFPTSGSKLKDQEAKTRLAVLAALRRPNLTLIASANPSTLIRLAQFIDYHAPELIRDIHDGRMSGSEHWPAEVRARLPRSLLRPDPARARELEEILRRSGRLLPRDCFPQLNMLAVWTGGSVGL
ncbi:MAG TPA: GH3 auxin-responsive promoter family protein, partial [Gemmatales bacterium]|nr:GH3 auxin-responsive promoter family protein [Gemmatales bacterium]